MNVSLMEQFAANNYNNAI